MKVARAAEDRSIAFSPRHFDSPRGKGHNTTVQKTAASDRQQTERRRFSQHIGARFEFEVQSFTGKGVARDFKTPVRPLNLSSVNSSTGQSSGSLAPRANSSRVTPRSRPITTRAPDRSGLIEANARLQGLRAGILSERLGRPTPPSTGLPVGVFARPYAAPKRSEAEQAKAEKEVQLWHLERAMRCMRCFELQWGFVCAELEAAISRHQKEAKTQLLNAAMATCKLQKNLRNLKECKVVFECQGRSAKAGEAVGGLLHKLHKNRAALIQQVNQLKGSVKRALEDMPLNQGVVVAHGNGPPEKLMELLQHSMEILNAMEAIISQKPAAKLTETSGKLGLPGVREHFPEDFPLWENALLTRGVQRTVKAGVCAEETRGLFRKHRRCVGKVHALVGANIRRQQTLGSLREQAAQMADLMKVRGKKDCLDDFLQREKGKGVVVDV